MNYNDISFFESNLEKIEDYNTCTDYIGYHYFRILKTFKSDVGSFNWKGDAYQNPKHYNDAKLIEKFPLRFYLPVDALALKNKETIKLIEKDKNDERIGILDDPRIKHLVIMINGLNEYEEFYLKQYDFLAASFAENNIASVLLSTPFHLHRTVKFCNENEKDCYKQTQDEQEKEKIRLERRKKGNVYRPSDILLQHWENVFQHYHITFSDIVTLINKIKNCENQDTDPFDEDFSFYKTHFSPKTKITILGYSLGGLISFGCFLRHRDIIDKLILFNTPGSLKEVSSKRIKIDKEVWETTMQKLGESAKRIDDLKEQGHKTEYIVHFLNLLMGKPHRTIHEEIDDTKKRILQIMCGDDNVIDMIPWEEYFDYKEGDRVHKKISQHIFSEVGHNPILETRGSEIMHNITRIMKDHIVSEVNPTHWQENEIEKWIMHIIKKTPHYTELKAHLNISSFHKSFTIDKLRHMITEVLTDDNEKKKFLKFYYLSKMYFPKFYDLIEKNKKKDEKH